MSTKEVIWTIAGGVVAILLAVIIFQSLAYLSQHLTKIGG